jgi:Mn2+/Fe2+ NRAMP family transporter
MGPIQTDELTRTLVLIIGMLIAGTLISAGLAYTTAYLIEQKRKQRTIDVLNK